MITGESPSERALLQRLEIENFLYQEARLIDEGRLTEWLALFTEDARYWVPANRDTIDPAREVSIIYDNREHLEDRVWRLQSGLAHVTDPPSRIRHLITNIQIDELTNGGLAVRANVVVYHARRGVQSAFVGHCQYRLRRVDDAWRIAFKKVELLNNNDPLSNLQFIF